MIQNKLLLQSLLQEELREFFPAELKKKARPKKMTQNGLKFHCLRKDCADHSGNRFNVKDVRFQTKEKETSGSMYFSCFVLFLTRADWLEIYCGFSFDKTILHNANLFIFLVFSNPNCFLTELFQPLVQYNRRLEKKPLA